MLVLSDRMVKGMGAEVSLVRVSFRFEELVCFSSWESYRIAVTGS